MVVVVTVVVAVVAAATSTAMYPEKVPYTRAREKHLGHRRDPAIGSAAVVGRDAATYYHLWSEDAELGVFII